MELGDDLDGINYDEDDDDDGQVDEHFIYNCSHFISLDRTDEEEYMRMVMENISIL